MLTGLSQKWSGLLFLLVLAFMLEAQMGPSVLTELITLGLFALSLLGAAVLSQKRGITRSAFIALGGIWYLSSAAVLFGASLQPITTVLSGVLVAGSLYGAFRSMTMGKSANWDVLLSAIYGYLLLIMLWAILYLQIERWHPGSFYLPEGSDVWSTLLFFSIVTMTTLGYGDVLPISGNAQMLAGFQAIVGVLYIAVLIGTIVGSFRNGTDKRS